MIYRVRHVTAVGYGGLVSLARFNLRLKPAPWHAQHVTDYQLCVQPAPATREDRPGAYPVEITRIRIDDPLTDLRIESRFRVAVSDDPAPAPAPGDPDIATVRRHALDHPDLSAMAPANYLFASLRTPPDDDIGAWAAQELNASRPVVEAGLALARRIRREFTYSPGSTDAGTPAAHAFAAKRGVCQDFAHIMVIACRMAGLPAAYVSGYLRTNPPPGRPRLVGADATHAWAMLWCGPQRGWIGMDPTNGVTAGPDHIFVAMGRDYDDVLPMDGMFVGRVAQTLDVGVDVVPETEEPG